MTDPIRALCVKLTEDVRYLSECLRHPEDGHDPVCLSECEADYHEARELLAQPTPPAEGDVVDTHRQELQRLLGSALDALYLPGHILCGEDLLDACLLSGRYCEPFTGARGHQPTPPAEGEVGELVAALRDPYISPLLRERIRAADLLERQQPAPAAEGEVAELVKWLRSRAGIPASPDFPAVVAYLTRAADLLDRQQPVPVPVSERLPGAEDCDAEGRCWWGDAGNDEFVPSWRLCERPDKPCFTHWLPAHALPMPTASPGSQP